MEGGQRAPQRDGLRPPDAQYGLRYGHPATSGRLQSTTSGRRLAMALASETATGVSPPMVSTSRRTVQETVVLMVPEPLEPMCTMMQRPCINWTGWLTLVFGCCSGACASRQVPREHPVEVSDAPPLERVTLQDRMIYLDRQGVRAVDDAPLALGGQVLVAGFATNTPFGPSVATYVPLPFCEGLTSWDAADEGRYVVVLGRLVHRPGAGPWMPFGEQGAESWKDYGDRERLELGLEQCTVSLGFPLSSVPQDAVERLKSCVDFDAEALSQERPPMLEVEGQARQLRDRMMLQCGGDLIDVHCDRMLRWPDAGLEDDFRVEGELSYTPSRCLHDDCAGVLIFQGDRRGHFAIDGCPEAKTNFGE